MIIKQYMLVVSFFVCADDVDCTKTQSFVRSSPQTLSYTECLGTYSYVSKYLTEQGAVILSAECIEQ